MHGAIESTFNYCCHLCPLYFTKGSTLGKHLEEEHFVANEGKRFQYKRDDKNGNYFLNGDPLETNHVEVKPDSDVCLPATISQLTDMIATSLANTGSAYGYVFSCDSPDTVEEIMHTDELEQGLGATIPRHM